MAVSSVLVRVGFALEPMPKNENGVFHAGCMKVFHKNPD